MKVLLAGPWTASAPLAIRVADTRASAPTGGANAQYAGGT